MISAVPRALVVKLCQDLDVDPSRVQSVNIDVGEVTVVEIDPGRKFLKRITTVPIREAGDA